MDQVLGVATRAFKSADATYKERDKDKAAGKRAAEVTAEEEKVVADDRATAAERRLQEEHEARMAKSRAEVALMGSLAAFLRAPRLVSC